MLSEPANSVSTNSPPHPLAGCADVKPINWREHECLYSRKEYWELMRNAKAVNPIIFFIDSAECVTKFGRWKENRGGVAQCSFSRTLSHSLLNIYSIFRPLRTHCQLLFLLLFFNQRLWVFYIFFRWLLTEIPQVFKPKKKKKKIATIWGLHMEKPDSAQLLCFFHPESTLLLKLSAKWHTYSLMDFQILKKPNIIISIICNHIPQNYRKLN